MNSWWKFGWKSGIKMKREWKKRNDWWCLKRGRWMEEREGMRKDEGCLGSLEVGNFSGKKNDKNNERKMREKNQQKKLTKLIKYIIVKPIKFCIS